MCLLQLYIKFNLINLLYTQEVFIKTINSAQIGFVFTMRRATHGDGRPLVLERETFTNVKVENRFSVKMSCVMYDHMVYLLTTFSHYFASQIHLFQLLIGAKTMRYIYRYCIYNEMCRRLLVLRVFLSGKLRYQEKEKYIILM